MSAPRDRMTVAEVAKRYGTSKRNVKPLTERGEIPYHRIEHYIKADGSSGERYVYLRSMIDADLRRAGELTAEARAS